MYIKLSIMCSAWVVSHASGGMFAVLKEKPEIVTELPPGSSVNKALDIKIGEMIEENRSDILFEDIDTMFALNEACHFNKTRDLKDFADIKEEDNLRNGGCIIYSYYLDGGRLNQAALEAVISTFLDSYKTTGKMPVATLGEDVPPMLKESNDGQLSCEAGDDDEEQIDEYDDEQMIISFSEHNSIIWSMNTILVFAKLQGKTTAPYAPTLFSHNPSGNAHSDNDAASAARMSPR